jgi:23S rRNA (cytidine2498-2'-O)-methyltransferase
MAISTLERHICITRKDQEGFIHQELSPLAPSCQCTHLAPGVVELTGVDLPFLSQNPLLFSRQLLPHAFAVEGSSIKAIAQAVVAALMERFEEAPPAWCVHIYDPAAVDTGEEYSRPRLIHQEVLTILKQRRRTLAKALCPTWSPDTHLAQVVIAAPTLTLMSISSPEEQRALRANISPYPAGYVDIADDKSPPSRAFKKLREAIEVFHLSPKRGETCVDLGACPGGWTHVMVERGLRATAIDRSPLDDRLMRNKNVTFIKGDAFTWLPKEPVSWLICDVITSPDRTLGILDTWLSKRLCSFFCVTVKFKGTPDFENLLKIRELLRATTRWYDGKQLTNNKNELTVVGEIAPRA